MPSDKRQCTYIREDGSRCACTFGLSPDGLCWHHDPEREQERKEAAARGGQTTKERLQASFNPAKLPELDSLEACLEWCTIVGRAVLENRVGDKPARVALTAVREARDTLGALAVDAGLEELDSRLEEIEAQLNAQRSLRRA